MGGGFTGIDGHQCGTELGKFCQHKLVNPFPDRGKQHHGGDTHRDTQHGQETAQLCASSEDPVNLIKSLISMLTFR